MSSSSLKRLAFALALTGALGTLSVLAAPKVASTGKTATASKPAPKKPATTATQAPQKLKAPASKKPAAPVEGGAVTSALKPTSNMQIDADKGQVTMVDEEVPFAPSRYPGVMVRSVPNPATATEKAPTNSDPVVLSERTLPDGSKEVVVQSLSDVYTVEPPATVDTPAKVSVVKPRILVQTETGTDTNADAGTQAITSKVVKPASPPAASPKKAATPSKIARKK